MAVATVVLTVAAFPFGGDAQQRSTILRGTVSGLAGNTYTTNGVPISWQLVSGNAGGRAESVNTTGLPNPYTVSFFSLGAAGTVPAYTYIYSPTLNTLRIFNGQTELANAATITADSVGWYAEFTRF